MTTMRTSALVFSLFLALTACSDDSVSTTAPETTSGATTTTGADAGTTTTGPQATSTTAPATTAPEGAGQPLFEGLDAAVTLVTATSGGGGRPLLEWQAVDGADLYVVFLYAPSGEVYWVWSGAATAVHVGGEPP
jgi:hypothetical protein